MADDNQKDEPTDCSHRNWRTLWEHGGEIKKVCGTCGATKIVRVADDEDEE